MSGRLAKEWHLHGIGARGVSHSMTAEKRGRLGSFSMYKYKTYMYSQMQMTLNSTLIITVKAFSCTIVGIKQTAKVRKASRYPAVKQ